MEEVEAEKEARVAGGDDVLMVGEVMEKVEEEEEACEWVGGLLAVDGRVGGSERGETVVTYVLLPGVRGEPVCD